MRGPAALLLSLLLATPGVQAQEKPAAAPPPATPANDFDLLPPEKVADPAERAREEQLQRALDRRRTLLQLHQGLGFATVAAVGAAVVIGQLNYNDKYGGLGDTGKYNTAHKIAGYGAFGIFTATGLFALLAPSPFDKPLRFDTGTLHKASMAVATAGMVAQVALGIFTRGKEGTLAQRDLALAHQIVGYTTLVATTTGFFIFAF